MINKRNATGRRAGIDTMTKAKATATAGSGSRQAPGSSQPITLNADGDRAGKPVMDPNETRPAKLRIFDKEVQISCRPGEEDDLLQAAAYIDKSMRDLRKRNVTSSTEKIAIVTAINTANALLKSRTKQSDDSELTARVGKLNEQLDELLDTSVKGTSRKQTDTDNQTS